MKLVATIETISRTPSTQNCVAGSQLAMIMPVVMIDQQPGGEEGAEDRAAAAEDVGAAEHGHQHHLQLAAEPEVVAHGAEPRGVDHAGERALTTPVETKSAILMRRARMPAWQRRDLAGADLVDLPAEDGGAEHHRQRRSRRGRR